MKIELVGGPHCGMIVDRTVAHVPAPGDVWRATYVRTGLRVGAARHRFDYAGQERGA